MPSFHETQFPPNISYGAKGGPIRLTQVVQKSNGFEERNQPAEHSRRKYNAAAGLRSIEHVQDILRFWEARRGKLYGFRWKDWADYQTSYGKQVPTDVDVIQGVGDGTEQQFQLVKRYIDAGEEYIRPIHKPVENTVSISIDDTPLASGWSVDLTSGVVTFDAAPALDAVIKAGFQFDVPVRFDADQLPVSVDAFQAGSVPAINIVEIRVA